MTHPGLALRRSPGYRVLLATAALLVASCTEGSGPTGMTPTVGISIEFSVAPSRVDVPDPVQIDLIRLIVVRPTQGDTLVRVEREVDPAQSEWAIGLSIPLNGGGAQDVVVEVELLSASEVQWSGRSSPTSVSSSGAPKALSIALYRGPVANLDVTSVVVTGGPPPLDEGQTAQLAHQLTLADSSRLASVRVYWTSSDPAVATVDASGLVRALLPGTASITATAGPSSDAIVVSVRGVAASVVLQSSPTRITSLGQRVVFQAEVVDARGDPVTGYTVSWAVTDSAVLAPVGAGAFDALTTGMAEVVATVVERPAVEGRAQVEVSQEVATAVLSADTVRLASLGATQQLTLSAMDAGGALIGTLSAAWTTSDPTVATVASDGTVTAVANGSAVVTANVSSALLAVLASVEMGPPGLALGMDTIAVSAVVEVNQVVATVSVTPADTVVGGLGEIVQFAAAALDAGGNPVQSATFAWLSSDVGVATVNATGLATSVGFGVTLIEATAAGITGTTTLTTTTAGGPTHVWIGGASGAPRDWANAGNWTPNSVPTTTDRALVPAAASQQPQLTAATTAGGLVVEDGATLDLAGFQLTLSGDLDAGNTIVGPGSVRMVGDTTSVQGTVPDLVIAAVVSVSGALDVVGGLTVSGGTLDVGARTVTVTGGFSTAGSGTLTMQNAAGVLDVAGNAYFNGGSTAGLLTNGVLRVGGNFTSWSSAGQNFAATGNHRTIFDGTAAQTIDTYYNAAGQSRFWDLEIDNVAGVTLVRTTRVSNDVLMTSGTLGGAQTMVIGGDLTEVVGGLQYRVGSTTFSGLPTLPDSVQTNATFTNAYALPQNVTVVGIVTVSGTGATLDIGAWTMSVTGGFSTANGGTLTMQNAAGVLDVAGNAYFNGGSTSGLLTDGVLRVGGNFTSWSSDGQNFAATSNHRTIFDGTAAQTIDTYYNAAGQSRFWDLEIQNAAGVTMVRDMRVSNDVDIATTFTVNAGLTATISGTLTLQVAGTLNNSGTVTAAACSLLGAVNGPAPICG